MPSVFSRMRSRNSSSSSTSLMSPFSPMAYSLPRSEKYTSNTVSNARQCALFFTSVAARAYLNASRSEIGMWRTACMASRFSVRLTGRPASRSSCMKPASSERIGSPVAATTTSASSATSGRAALLPALALGRELLHGLRDVALVLQQDVDGSGRGLRVDVLDAEQQQRASPVERLGHRRRLLELELADRTNDARDL